jgi:hypothetical protein
MLTVMRLRSSMSQKQKIVNMKIIITEDQYNNLSLRRRLSEIMHEGLFIIDNGDEFYGDDAAFCNRYPTFKAFMEGFIDDIVYQYNNMTGDHIWDFIYEDLGHENFIDLLLDTHGEDIINFYNRKTKDC